MIAGRLRALRSFIVFLLGIHDVRPWSGALGRVRLLRERWTGLLASSKGERNPSLHPSTIGRIFNAELSLQPRLVVQNPPLEPHCASNKQDEREPRLERNDESGHE